MAEKVFAVNRHRTRPGLRIVASLVSGWPPGRYAENENSEEPSLVRNAPFPDLSMTSGGGGMLFAVLDLMHCAVVPGPETILAATTTRDLAGDALTSAAENTTR